MVRVNFSLTKKAINLNDVGGINFSNLNIKLTLVVILLSYVPDWFVYGEYESALSNIEAEVKQLEIKQRNIATKKKGFDQYEEKFNELSEQKSKLNEKLKLVKKIITTRKNPKDLLYYIAKSTPKDTWIHELKIEQTTFELRGRSRDYKSIGGFIQNLKSSVFFGNTIKLDSSKTVEIAQNKRVEEFILKGNILRFK